MNLDTAGPGVVGVLERRNPVPKGIYWVDVFEPNLDLWAAWVRGVGDAVRVLKVVPHHDESPDREWILFEVVSPVGAVWDARFGLPTIAPKGRATEESDTEEAPDLPQDATDTIDPLKAGASLFTVGVLVLLVVLFGAASKGQR